jgi:hypothetical protein
VDIVAHGLWAAAGVTWAARRWPITRRAASGAVALAVMPDLPQYLPLVAWWLFGAGRWGALRDYAVALPGHEPALPAAVALLSHHLHCAAHSALVAGAASALVWPAIRAARWPLLGWWSHIAIDAFSHSADFYPVPLLYPLSYRGLDGIAWNKPAFMVFNYAALALVWLALSRSACAASRGQRDRRASIDAASNR